MAVLLPFAGPRGSTWSWSRAVTARWSLSAEYRPKYAAAGHGAAARGLGRKKKRKKDETKVRKKGGKGEKKSA